MEIWNKKKNTADSCRTSSLFLFSAYMKISLPANSFTFLPPIKKQKKIEFWRFPWETCLDISQKDGKDFSQRLVALKGFTMLWLKKKEQRLKMKTDTIG